VRVSAVLGLEGSTAHDAQSEQTTGGLMALA
jgi:hypothetical protein